MKTPTPTRRSFRQRLLTVLKVAFPVLCSIGTLIGLKLVMSRSLFSPEELSAHLARWGGWAALAFVAALAVRPILLLPGQVFTAVAGMLWGGLWGTVIAMLGSSLSMLVVCYLGRSLLRRPLERWSGDRRAELEKVARRHDFFYAVLVTLNPLFPTDVAIALAAGAGARVRRLVLGTALGTIPGTVATAAFGSAVVGDRPWLMAASIAGMVISLAGGIAIGRSAWKSLKSAPAPSPEAAEAPAGLPRPVQGEA